MNPHNRRVHASTDQMEVVRYFDEDEWRLEPTATVDYTQVVGLEDAVSYALWAYANEPSFRLSLGIPGGEAFEERIYQATRRGPS